ncbi:nucleotidyltransferase family protein [Hydrogenophaga sp. 5NK40-0174]
MNAIILAAGRGKRMRPLTDATPKPLLAVHGRPMVQWLADALSEGGLDRLVVNTEWLGEQVTAFFESWNVAHPNVALQFSHEGLDFGYALETAGGISRALPMLGEVFWAMAGDVYVPEFDFSSSTAASFAQSDQLAHLWLVPNPEHNPGGDFGLDDSGRALNVDADQARQAGIPRYTFSTIALYKRALFEAPWSDVLPGNPQGTSAPLAPLLRKAMDAGRVSAELFDGAWMDVGTPERLAQINAAGQSHF